MEQLQAIAATAQAAVTLVLPAGLCVEEAADLARGYARAGARHLVATRIDLARRLGSGPAAAQAGRLSLAEAGIGPGAADGLTPLTPEFLAERLLPYGVAAYPPSPDRCRFRQRRSWQDMALHLASPRARKHGRRVLLFDADLGLANVDIQLGLMSKHDLSAVLSGKASLWDAIVLIHPEGFHILPGRSGSGTLAGLSSATVDRVLALARTAAAEDHITLLDLGAGLEPPVRRMAAGADELLIITTDEPTSLTDAYAVLKLHAQDAPNGPARIVVNQAPSPSAGERTYATIRRAATTFLSLDPPLAGIIRRDGRVPEFNSCANLTAHTVPHQPRRARYRAVAARDRIIKALALTGQAEAASR